METTVSIVVIVGPLRTRKQVSFDEHVDFLCLGVFAWEPIYLHNVFLFSPTMNSLCLLNFDAEQRSSSLLDFLFMDPRGETVVVIFVVIVGPLRTSTQRNLFF